MKTPLRYLTAWGVAHEHNASRRAPQPAADVCAQSAGSDHVHPRTYRTNARLMPWPWRDAFPGPDTP